MKNMRLICALALACVLGSPAFAVDNSSLPVCNSGTCGGTALETFANKDVAGVKFPKQIPYNSSGTELFTSSNPAQVTGANGTFPASQSGTWNINNIAGTITLPTGAATAANQSTIITALGTLNTTASNPVVGPLNMTANDCSGTIGTGGTAQNAFTAQTALHGFTVANIDASAGSGEPLWISFTTTAAANTAASYPLQAPAASTFATGGSFTAPFGFGLGHALSIIGATTGHKFSCTWW